MQITKQSNGIIELKTKNASAILDKSVRIGDVVLNGPGEYDVAGIAVVGFPGDEQPFY
jgi:hypothetical protein